MISSSKPQVARVLYFLVAIPVLLTIALLIYLYRAAPLQQIESSWLIPVTVLFFSGCYLTTAIVIVKGIVERIRKIGVVLPELSKGRSITPFPSNGSDELSVIEEAVNDLNKDLTEKISFAESIAAGNIESSVTTLNCEDRLARSLKQISAEILTGKDEEKKRAWSTDALATFVEVLRSGKRLKDLSNDIIIHLVRILNANQGAVYMLNDKEQTLEMQACYAYKRTKYLEHKVAVGNGLIGQTFLEKQTLYLKDVPDSFVRITSGLGESNPRFILITPLTANDEVVGVIEIASFKGFEPHEIAFVEKISESIAHTVRANDVAEQTQRLLRESHERTEQMRAQEEELRQNQEELQATQEEISRKYEQLFAQLTQLNYQSKFDQLRSITSTKKRNIEYYFDIIRNQIITFSENKMVIEAVQDFRASFQHVHEGIPAAELEQMAESLRKYYTDEFIPRLQDNSDSIELPGKYIPVAPETIVLQYRYISGNPHATGKKLLLTDAGDSSAYDKAHNIYHPIIRSYLEKFGYYDIFLIDAKTGEMLYSVFKEVDFATNLSNGIYHSTNFGDVVKECMSTSDPSFVKLVDFAPYVPSYGAPASFIACPVYDNGEKIGIVVFQMPINKINQILTGDYKWKEDGLGETGETFIVGEDHKIRSIARELVENPVGYFQALRDQGYAANTIRHIEKTKTSILLESVKQESVSKALQGMEGTQIEVNGKAQQVLSAFAPLHIPDVHWMIMSVMKESEASAHINDLRKAR